MKQVFFATLLCIFACRSASADPVRLGYLLDLSGKGVFMGQQSQAGVQ